MRILLEDTAAVIIDMQERIYSHIYQNEQLTKNTEILIKGLKAMKAPMLVTQQYTKGLGGTIQPVHNALGEYEVIEKSSFSCCDDNNFCFQLARLNKKNVIIAGIESHVCVLQTTIDLIEKGYNPVVVLDCVSSRFKENKKYAIKRMTSEGATITTYESILFELLRYSGTETFKVVSKLVK